MMRARRRIGRLYIERWPSQHRVIDIAFLPAHRGKGFGAALLSDLIDEAAPSARRCRSMSRRTIRPCNSIVRLGFTVAEDKGVYDLMVRSP